jgi:diguanylate cyclase (GGDEF)-like protein
MCPLAATMKDGALREAEVYLHHKDGHRVPVLVRAAPLTDEDGSLVGAIELFTDVSTRQADKLRVSELEQLAMLDPLTEIANRRYMEHALSNRLDEWRRYQMPFRLLFVDIDGFKAFNDSYGHDVGDTVLRAVAKTLVRSSRSFDLYGRWGGEEFVGALRNVDREALATIGQRVLQLVRHVTVAHDGRELGVTVSIGATVAEEGDTVESFVRRADQLMYRSKADGRNRLTVG